MNLISFISHVHLGNNSKKGFWKRVVFQKRKMDIFHSGGPTKELKKPPISLHACGHGDTRQSDKKKTSHENIKEYLLMVDRWENNEVGTAETS